MNYTTENTMVDIYPSVAKAILRDTAEKVTMLATCSFKPHPDGGHYISNANFNDSMFSEAEVLEIFRVHLSRSGATISSVWNRDDEYPYEDNYRNFMFWKEPARADLRDRIFANYSATLAQGNILQELASQQLTSWSMSFDIYETGQKVYDQGIHLSRLLPGVVDAATLPKYGG